MVLIKRMLIGIVALLVLFFVVGFLLPREARVERSVEIDALPQDVFAMVNDFQQFNRWQPWALIDPSTRYVFEGPSTGAGSRMLWRSDHPQVGDGMQEIVESLPYSKVRALLDFGTGGIAYANYVIEAREDGSVLTWTLETDMGSNPLGRYVGLMMDGMIGPSYEQGLANLKAILEGAPSPQPRQWPQKALENGQAT